MMGQLLEGLESRLLLTTSTFNAGYSFTDGSDGGVPNAVVVDGNGNVFVSTSTGGGNGLGTFVGISAVDVGTTSPSVIGNLDQTDTGGVNANLVVDSSGNVFGTSEFGGVASNGSIYEVSTLTRTPQVIYSFTYGTGATPNPTLTIDAAGDLFGTTVSGGTNGDGQVFEISARSHNFSTIYSFLSTDGTPGPVVVDGSGNIFGVMTTGGENGTGTLFEIQQGRHSVTTLASLPAGIGTPSLAVDANDNVFGTTRTGGTSGAGTIFEYKAASASLVTLYNFPVASASSFPNAHIVVDAADDVFGTTANGTSGIAFELPAGQSTLDVLQTFASSTPTYGLTASPTGVLYGLTSNGGANSEGSLFSLTVNTSPPATRVVFSEEPASVTAGTLGTITVTVEDAAGDVVNTDHSQVTLKVASGPGKLTGTVTVAAVNGVATFSKAVLGTAGTYTLQATDGALTAATSTSFTVTPGAATHLVFVQQPTTTVAGVAVAPALTVYVEDKSNNVVVTNSSTITLALAGKPVGGAIAGGGGQVSVAAVNGIASFSGLIFDVAGTYSLLASDGVLKSVKSKSCVVNADAATAHLVLTQTPATSAVVGAKLSPLVVVLKDQFGNIVKGSNSSVVVTETSGPTNGKIVGTLSASIRSGTATFKGISATLAGSYVLAVGDAALVNASNVPLSFAEVIGTGITTIPVIKASRSYTLGKTIVLHTTLQSNAPTSIPYTGTATVTDSAGDVIGTAVVSAKGAVTATITGLAAGTFICTLNYSGDVNHTVAQSASFAIVVVG
jgi:uncharacterized repeat protein (TIGR03803 family)